MTMPVWCRKTRVVEQELLEFADPAAAEPNLRDLVRINRWFGGHRALLRVLKPLVSPSEQFSVLDVGAASGDMGESIRGRFRNATVISLDRSSLHLHRAEAPKVTADAFRLPFKHGSFDFVLCSSFLHHFSDSRAIELIAALRQVARRALIVLDLDRHPVARAFLPLTRWLLQWNELTVHDGTASVAAAFRPGEIAFLARAAGAVEASVRRHWPWYRLSLVIPATNGTAD